MKSNQFDVDDDAQLRSVLREWVVDTPLPPRFQEQMWQRIARAEARLPAPLWTRMSQWLETVLPRPKVAVSYLALLLGLGVTAGSLFAQARTSELNATLSHRYVQSIDPYQENVPLP